MITPSQTVGPFFGPAMLRDERNVIDGDGERIRIEGQVRDGDGAPVPDAMIELWQADADGQYDAPGFLGFARAGTDDEGMFWFETVKPGPVGSMAPHLSVAVFARGLMNHLDTRIYFDDEPLNGSDPVLARVPPERRHTLMATRGVGHQSEHAQGRVGGKNPSGGGAQSQGAPIYHWIVTLQGEPTVETVFFRWLTS